MQKVSVVIPNWNGEQELPIALDSLLRQNLVPKIIVVDNGSTDNSLQLLETAYPSVEVLSLPKNKGFAGGVNAGIKRAINDGCEYVALLNNDAKATKSWLENLVEVLSKNPKAGIAASKILNGTGEYLDSTGDIYSIWGLPYPRGRREADTGRYDEDTKVFAASGGASLYRVKMLNDIGLFDEDFFAYYEDVDISFRAQLSGWKVAYVPSARVYHQIGGTSRRLSGFTTYQTMKNLPWLMWKNVPAELLPRTWPRFMLAYWAFYARSLTRGQAWPATKGLLVSTAKWPKKLLQRRKIQKNRKVSAEYINSVMFHDLPPNAHNLRALRGWWWKLRRKKAAA